MDLRKLRHAVALGRQLNFTKTANTLNLTQSALSRSIQALEEECHLRLFDRNRNTVSVTAAGREFIHHAEIMLRKEAELMDMVSHAARGDGGSVALGMSPLAARTLLAPLMTEIIAKPGFHATVSLGLGKKLLPLLLDETIHICVITGPDSFSHPLITSVPLARLPVSIVIRAGHPLSQLPSVTPAELEGYPLLRTHLPDPEDHDAAGDELQRQPFLTIEDYDVLMKITASSDAVWVTTPISARDWLISGVLKQVPIVSSPKTYYAHMTALHLKNKTVSPTAKKVFTRLCDLSNEIFKPTFRQEES